MNSMKRLSHKVTMNLWHFEWCTKYRYKMMQRLEIKILWLLRFARQHTSTLPCATPRGISGRRAVIQRR
ncbi:MAG TPA: hypothetical protein VJB08_03650 [Candidatus Nanoarchaeia archaeon]|nr:hypothetical protein [Candidatus Nanoarchaeia archaeon]